MSWAPVFNAVRSASMHHRNCPETVSRLNHRITASKLHAHETPSTPSAPTNRPLKGIERCTYGLCLHANTTFVYTARTLMPSYSMPAAGGCGTVPSSNSCRGVAG